jgi:hypothetical protein
MAVKDRVGDVRAAIAELLADGLVTQTSPVPVPGDKEVAEGAEVAEVLRALREAATDDSPNALRDKLVVAGMLDHPNGNDQQRCMECMYFVVHRKWCDLPELSLPVEPEWWCRLWRN